MMDSDVKKCNLLLNVAEEMQNERNRKCWQEGSVSLWVIRLPMCRRGGVERVNAVSIQPAGSTSQTMKRDLAISSWRMS